MSSITRRGFLSTTAGLAALAVSGISELSPAQAPPASRPSAISDISMEDVDPHPEELAATRPGERPVINFRRVRPVEFKGDLLNPHLGTQTFQRFNGDPTNVWIGDANGPENFPPYKGDPKNDHYPDTTVAYCRWVWRALEPEEGKYRWEIIDGALKSAEDRGQTLHVRLQPFVGPMPDWYWKAASTQPSRQPDANSPDYVKHFGNLIREFGRRYDGHPTLEAFDIAYAGAFGEMGGNASPEVSADLVDIYVQSLPKTQLVAMIGTYGCIYAMKLSRAIGWRGDCFGDLRRRAGDENNPELRWDHMHDEYPRRIFQAHAVDQWKIAPVVEETCGTVSSWFRQNYDIDWIIEQMLKYHPTFFMNKSSPIPEAWWDKIMAFNRRLGYRFVLRQFDLPQRVTAGQLARMSVFMDNVGVAPIYRPYKLALRFTQGPLTKILPFDQDIRKWLPDINWFAEHVRIPPELQSGTAQIDMGIVDGENRPKVKLSIEGIGKDGWYPMCPIQIG